MSDIVFTKYHLKKGGGLEKYSLKIINKYLEKKYSLTLLTTEPSSDLAGVKNLKIVLFKIPRFISFFRLKLFEIKCKKWIKKNNPKAVFSFDTSGCYTHARLGNGIHLTYLKRKKMFENPFIFFLNFINPKNLLLSRMEKKGFNQADLQKIIVNSNMVQKELLRSYRIDPAKIEIIHNGVEFTDFENDFNDWQTAKEDTIRRLNLKIEDFHFIFVGNGYKRKGLVLLLKALSKIKDRPFHLSIIGKEKKMKKFNKLAKKLELEEKVSFFGKRADIIKFYQLADALVIPSYYDPFSNAVIEALAMGVFAITSQFNGAKEIITGKNGMIIDISDQSSLIKALHSAMAAKKDRTRASAIRESVKHLDLSKQLEKLIKAINI